MTLVIHVDLVFLSVLLCCKFPSFMTPCFCRFMSNLRICTRDLCSRSMFQRVQNFRRLTLAGSTCICKARMMVVCSGLNQKTRYGFTHKLENDNVQEVHTLEGLPGWFGSDTLSFWLYWFCSATSSITSFHISPMEENKVHFYLIPSVQFSWSIITHVESALLWRNCSSMNIIWLLCVFLQQAVLVCGAFCAMLEADAQWWPSLGLGHCQMGFLIIGLMAWVAGIGKVKS